MSSANYRRQTVLITLLFAAIALTVYWLTAYRSITWWIGSSFSAVAVCLGVGNPPGSLILTVAGWLVTKLPLGISKAFSLNLFAGLISAVTIAMTMLLARGLITDAYDRRTVQGSGSPALLVGIVTGLVSLILAFGETMWKHSIMFQPYVLTVLFTALILWALLNWWREAKDEAAWRWIFLAMLLLGLDLSVHRTNLVLLPGVLVWLLLRHAGSLARVKVWLGGIAGALVGAAFHLLLILIARADPPVNANDPSNWSRFYDYISLKQYGGGWLVNLFPRKAPFIDVQLKDYADFFTANFAYIQDSFGVMAVLPLLLGTIGLIMLIARHSRLAIGLFVFFLIASIGEVFYFNTPGEFFWPMDRHYLPSFMIFIMLAAYGAGRIALYLRDHPGFWRAPALCLIILVLITAPAVQFRHNYATVDSSHKTFAHDYSMNVLNTIEKDAILFVTGDRYWLFLYHQLADNARPDVNVISTSLTNTNWYLKQLKDHHQLLPFSLTEGEIDQLTIPLWPDTTIAIEVAASPPSYGVPDSYVFPDSMRLAVPPNIADRYLMLQDWFLIHLMENNRYRRPVYFTQPPTWLQPYCRPDGSVWCAVPSEAMASDPDVLADNLMGKYVYAGYNDSTIFLDGLSSLTASELQRSFATLAWQRTAEGDTVAACETLRIMRRLLPVERIPYSELLAPAIKQLDEMMQCD